MPKTITTPVGTASYPWVTEPDTRYNPDGNFSVNLILTEEEATPLINAINNEWEAFRTELKGNKAKKLPTSLGYNYEFDEDGNETGNIIFKPKMKHIVRYKDKETGEEKLVEKRLPLFDATGKQIHPVSVWGGSKIACNITIKGYDAGANLGISLYLNAVQIIELVSGGGSASGEEATASSFGFGATDGYSAPEEETRSQPKSAVVDEDDF